MNGPHRQTWASAADIANLADGVPVNIKLLGRELCLIRCGQQVYALLDRCSHQDFPLSEGEVDDGAIECALHGSRFELATGAALGPPAVDPVPVFPVRVHMGEVYVGLPGDSDRSEDPQAQPTEIGPTQTGPTQLQEPAMIEVAFSETDSLELLDAARRAQAGRASRTVVGGQQHVMRQTVIVLLANAALSEHESPGEATLYVISGRVALSVGQETREAGSGELLVIPQRRHSLRALRHSTVLLTAVPREYTPAIDQGDPT